MYSDFLNNLRIFYLLKNIDNLAATYPVWVFMYFCEVIFIDNFDLF